MDQTMQIDELRRELRHVKSRRDSYMQLTTDLRKERLEADKAHFETLNNLRNTIRIQSQTIHDLTQERDKLQRELAVRVVEREMPVEDTTP